VALNPAAHEAYLKGRYYWAKSTDQALRESIEYFETAIAKDSGYAPAYARRSDAYSLLCAPILEVVPQSEVMTEAKASATKALELDGPLAEAHDSLGRIKYYFDWDWAGSEKDLPRGVELCPNYASAHSTYALLLSALGRYTEAIREARHALELDPLSLLINTILGIAYSKAREFGSAEAQFRKTLELDPDFAYAHWMLGAFCLVPMRRYDEGITEFQKAIESAENVALPRGLLGLASAEAGKRDEALRVLDEQSLRLHRSRRRAHVRSSGRGLPAALPVSGLVGVEPQYDELQSHPRFQNLLRRMNLPQVSPGKKLVQADLLIPGNLLASFRRVQPSTSSYRFRFPWVGSNWQRQVQCRARSGKASQGTLSGDARYSNFELAGLRRDEGLNELPILQNLASGVASSLVSEDGPVVAHRTV